MQSSKFRTAIFDKLTENSFNSETAELSTLGILLISYLLITIILFWISKKTILDDHCQAAQESAGTKQAQWYLCGAARRFQAKMENIHACGYPHAKWRESVTI